MYDKKITNALDDATLKALSDTNFKAKLLIDANFEIKKEYDVELPFKVTFHENSPNHLIFVLPANKEDDQELDEDKLENVSGGVSSLKIDPKELQRSVCAYGCYAPGFLVPLPRTATNENTDFYL
ncbi:MAG: hypothetical protein RUMPE_00827 [Eubacteriales bacterium SKADARSKE-1]|nr:hypothetical protein [Eubacteriales bacterium SKADARSKE-1]